MHACVLILGVESEEEVLSDVPDADAEDGSGDKGIKKGKKNNNKKGKINPLLRQIENSIADKTSEKLEDDQESEKKVDDLWAGN